MENPENLPYSEAIKEIESILHQIEGQDLDIDELSGNVNRALALIKLCKAKLHNTENELEKALKDMDEPSTDDLPDA